MSIIHLADYPHICSAAANTRQDSLQQANELDNDRNSDSSEDERVPRNTGNLSAIASLCKLATCQACNCVKVLTACKQDVVLPDSLKAFPLFMLMRSCYISSPA